MKMPFVERGSGKPVVLLHAFPLSGTSWQAQYDALASGNFRIIAPDLRGFGENHNFGDINTMEDMANDVAELLENLKIEKAIIGGLSMGGYVAFNLYRTYPEKFAGLLLADTSCQADSDEKRLGRFALIDQIEINGSKAIVEMMLPKLTSDYSKHNNPKLIENLEKMIAAVDPKSTIAALRGLAARKDHCYILESISIPTLLIFGEHDNVANLETARVMKSKIVNSELNIISNAGHYSNLEQPEIFNEYLKNFVEGIQL